MDFAFAASFASTFAFTVQFQALYLLLYLLLSFSVFQLTQFRIHTFIYTYLHIIRRSPFCILSFFLISTPFLASHLYFSFVRERETAAESIQQKNSV